MKRTITAGFVLAFIALVAMSNRNGRAASTGLGSTGAPGDDATVCRSCHNGPTDVAVDIFLIDQRDTLTAYEPGKTYSIHVIVRHTGGTPPKAHGFQLTGLKAKLGINGEKITDLTPQSSNVKISIGRNGRTYAEQNDRSPNNLFITNWIAPAEGTGPVSFYAGGNAVNSNNNSDGDGGNKKSVQFEEKLRSSSDNLNTASVAIYPNPFQQKIQIECNQMISKIVIRDLLGKSVFQQTENSNKVSIDLSTLLDGIYFLQAMNAENKIMKTSKIVKRVIKA